MAVILPGDDVYSGMTERQIKQMIEREKYWRQEEEWVKAHRMLNYGVLATGLMGIGAGIAGHTEASQTLRELAWYLSWAALLIVAHEGLRRVHEALTGNPAPENINAERRAESIVTGGAVVAAYLVSRMVF